MNLFINVCVCVCVCVCSGGGTGWARCGRDIVGVTDLR